MRKRAISSVVAGVLCVQTLLSAGVGMQTVMARETGDSIAITQLPGTVVVEKEYDNSFLSVSGYVEGNISDRTIYYEEFLEYNRLLKEKWIADGKKAEDYQMKHTDNYYQVNNEEEFCEAVCNQAKVIELTTDLNLGYLYMEKNDMDDSGVVGKNITGNGEVAISSPDLIADGVSKIDFENVHGLMIYSKNGSTIYHCELNFNKCSDIVIRNIGIQGMNEWDDTEQGKTAAGNGPGGHKRYDWDNIAVNESTGVWIDHCSLGIAYDGSVDICGASEATISWCEIGKPDERTLEEMHRTIDYMEELYQAGKGHQFYTALRDGGATPNQIFEYSLINDKVHAFSESDFAYDKNIYDKITLAYNYYENSAQRVPQIRCGNAHMYNCWVNCDAYRKISKELSDASNGTKQDGNGKTLSPLKYAGNQGCSTLSLCRANSALGGATIGTDTCVFEGVINPIISSEMHTKGSMDIGVQTGALNHNLIVNSSTRDYGKEVYIGSSWDNNGENAFVSGDYWNAGKVTINHFKWAKWADVTQDESKASDTVVYISRIEAENMLPGEFYTKYYIGSDELGYEYQIVPLDKVKDTLTSYSGCGKVTLDEEGWLSPIYRDEDNTCRVTFDYQVSGEMLQTQYVTAGAVAALPEEPERTGYSFEGWYTKEYSLGEEDEDGDIELIYQEVPFTESSAITEDTYIYGKWKINTYKVWLDLNGGTNMGDAYYECNYNSFFYVSRIDRSLLKKAGYELEGWYLDEDLQKKAVYFKVLDEDVTIYAKWVEASEAPTPSVSPAPSESLTPSTSQTPSVSPLPSVSPAPSMSVAPYQKKGDVDGNGKIELADAQLTLKAALKITVLNEVQTKSADADENGKVELADAQLILKCALKIIEEL